MEFEGCLNGGKSMKAYLKPVLYYERFELSQHIASCDLKLTHNMGYGTGCTASGMAGGEYGIPVTNGFVEGDCEVGVNGYCYTNSIAIMGTHTS